MTVRCVVVTIPDSSGLQIVEFVVVPKIGELVILYTSTSPSVCCRYRVTDISNITYAAGYERTPSDYPPLVMLFLESDGSTEVDAFKDALSACISLEWGTA